MVAGEHRGSGLLGWVVRAQDLERIDWGEELLTRRSTSVAMAIGVYKHENAAWGSLILFVIAEIDDTRTAMLHAH